MVLAACLVLAAGFQFWLRDSTLVAVENVKVTGLTTKDAPRVRAALVSAAHTMTTLHVDQAELERAIAAYPVVRALHVEADFPHRLDIRVIEHRPAAMVGGLPVAGDGTILRGLPVEGRLPRSSCAASSTATACPIRRVLHAARVAGGAPAPLRGRLERIDMRAEEGIVVELRDGPELYFGNATRVRAKWIAAVRILADPEAAGASYIDVRLPGRPAAGGLPAETLAPVAPAGSAELAAPTGDRHRPLPGWIRPPSSSRRPPQPATERPPQTGTPPAARDRAGTRPSQPPLPLIPPGLEGSRRPLDNPHPLVELQGNPRPSLECLPA